MSPSVIFLIVSAIMLLIALAEKKKRVIWIPLVTASVLGFIASGWQLQREENAEQVRQDDSIRVAEKISELCEDRDCAFKLLIVSTPEELRENSPAYKAALERILAMQKTALDSAIFYVLAYDTLRAKTLLTSIETSILTDTLAVVTWFMRGYVHSIMANHDSAVIAYESALKLAPDNPFVLCMEGVSLANLNHEKAVTVYDKALKRMPKFPAALLCKGVSLAALKRRDEAILVYDEAIKYKPDMHEAHYNKGNCYYALDSCEKAIAAYDEAIKYKPEKHKAHYNRGVCLLALNRHEEAYAAFEKTTKYNPGDYEAHSNKGVCLVALNRNQEAMVAYDEAIRHNPDFHEAYYNKATLCAILRDRACMITSLQIACNLFSAYKQLARLAPDFEYYRTDPDFRKLVGLEEADSGGAETPPLGGQ